MMNYPGIGPRLPDIHSLETDLEWDFVGGWLAVPSTLRVKFIPE